MSDTITPPGGNTPAATQLASGQPNAQNSQAPANTTAPTDPNQMTDTQLSGAINTTQNQLTTAEQPQNIQNYLNNSNLPAMQSNYNDLAQQLFQYDKNVASPNYTPITPSSTPVMPTDQSPLELTMSALNAPNFNFTDPALAIQSQTAQKTTLNDLLDSLNSSIGKELSMREGTYASSTQSLKDILTPLLDLEKQREADKAAMARAQLSAGNSSSDKKLAEKQAIAQKIASSGQLGKDNRLSPQAYQSARLMAMNQYGWSSDDFDAAFGDLVNQAHAQDYGVKLNATEEKAANQVNPLQVIGGLLSGATGGSVASSATQSTTTPLGKVHITDGKQVRELNANDPMVQQAQQNGWRIVQ